MEQTFILKTLYNSELELNLNSFTSIMDIKKYIFEIKGIPIKKQYITFAGKELKNNLTLIECNIVNGTVINFIYPKNYDNNLNH